MKDESEKKIKWGIIGLGKIAHKFSLDLATVDNTELYAVASRTKEKAAQFSQEFNTQKAFGSYEDLVKDPSVDAVYIATPHRFHFENTLLCLQHKKAVLCEKPFAMNLQEVTQMIAVAKMNNVLLMEALWTCFLPHYQYLLNAIQQEKYGKITALKADFGFYTPYDVKNRLFQKEVGGGSLLDIGIYPIFAALSTLGVPEHIEAAATFFENGADASCDMVFHYNNATATLKSTLLEETKTTAVFTFEKATITIPKRFHEASTLVILQEGKEETVHFDYNSIGYHFEIVHFNRLLRLGKKESDFMTFDFSKNLIKTLDAVRTIIGLTY